MPHMNMPLFVDDVKSFGCSCECICVSRGKLEGLIIYLKKKSFDLIAVDYSFPIVFLNELKNLFPESKFVIGGNGFLDTFLKSKIDFAVIGAGRRSFLALVKALKSKTGISAIPNLFFRTKINNKTFIDYTGIDLGFDLKRELFPYRPYLKWRYIGFTRKDRVNDPPAIIAEFGCPYRSRKLSNIYKDLTKAKLSSNKFSAKASKRVMDLFKERMRGGCSFCTCPGNYVYLSVKDTVECLMKQARFLQAAYRFKSFVIGSENPFRFVERLIHQMIKEHMRIEILAIRSRVDWVNKNRKILFKIIGLAKKNNFVISLQQLGFESFIQNDLDVYNKGYRVSENFKAIELLNKLRNIAPENFQDGGHGLIGINPWITLSGLKKYCESAEHVEFLFDTFHFGNSLVLYDSCLPIYEKLKKDGLLVKRSGELDTWRFKNKNVMSFIDDYSKKYLLG